MQYSPRSNTFESSEGERNSWKAAGVTTTKWLAVGGAQTGQRQELYSEVIRLWKIVTDHDDMSSAMERICASWRKGQDAEVSLNFLLLGTVVHTLYSRILDPEKTARSPRHGCFA